ncbi:MAG: hypothetical protein LBC28_00920, partial [Oscillospiraceae bacterium]|nr:hypothetical protein [Oscillospiraceae bacterium]
PPPPPVAPGSTLVPGDDENVYIELGEDGTPLGEWRLNPDTGEWEFFPEDVPLGEMPGTGDNGLVRYIVIFAVAGGGAVLIWRIRRRQR